VAIEMCISGSTEFGEDSEQINQPCLFFGETPTEFGASQQQSSLPVDGRSVIRERVEFNPLSFDLMGMNP